MADLKIIGELINACLDDDIFRMKMICAKSPSAVNTLGQAGYPPLHYAIFKQNFELAKHLIEINADCNLMNYKGSNALHAAVILGDESLVQLIMPNIVDLEVRNLERDTALDIASRLPSVDDLQFPLIFKGWRSTDDEGEMISKISSGRLSCKTAISQEIERRTAYKVTFIRHSLFENQLNLQKLRNTYHGDRNFALRRFTSQITLPYKHTPLEWSLETQRVYNCKPEIARELDIRLFSMDVADRAISTAARNVVELVVDTSRKRKSKKKQDKEWDGIMKKIISSSDIIRSRR
jgi:hypothetical protein